MRGWQLLLLLGGCDSVFGIHTVDQIDAVPIDAPRRVTGSVTQSFVHRNPAGTDNVIETLPGFQGGLTMNYLTDDTQTLVMVDASGDFSFVAAPGPYRVSIQATGDSFVFELQLSDDTIDLTSVALRSPSVGFVDTPVTISAPGLANPPYFALLGEWLPGVLAPPGTAGGSFTSNSPFTLDPTIGDRALLFEYANPSSSPTNSVKSLGAISLVITDSQPVMATFTMAPPTAHCARMVGDYATLLARLLPFAQSGDDGGNAEWVVGAYPTLEIAPTYAGLPIAYDVTNNLGSTATVADLTNYTLPLLASASVSRLRMIDGVEIGSTLTALHPLANPSGVCPAISSTETFPSTIAIASAPTLDGTALDVKDTTMVDRTDKAVLELAWTPTNANVDGWEIEIDIANPDSSGNPTTIRAVFTDSPSIKIPASIFSASTPYIFKINALLGTPNAKHGDFTTVTYPFETSGISTYVFMVKG